MYTERERIEELKAEGFEADYDIRDGALVNIQSGKAYEKGEVHLLKDYRFEGRSNPSDMSILYAMETSSGEKGTLLVNYGPNTPQEIVRFFRDLEEKPSKSDN
ncbi:MAG: hypothetical protein P8Z38_12355 [Robiginitalea sp.]